MWLEAERAARQGRGRAVCLCLYADIWVNISVRIHSSGWMFRHWSALKLGISLIHGVNKLLHKNVCG